MLLAAGTRLGPYEILAPIGAGGMGEVYKASDTRLDRVVALKISKTEFNERFEREARAIAALNHPRICQLYDVGPNYLVMEYIEGTPLKGPLPVEQAVNYAAQICDALDAAQRRGITHRDLKPANILVTKSGIKLLDFGLAKMRSTAVAANYEAVTETMTAEGRIVGTLNYMSPEQLQGREADERSDIFSLGVLLYEILSGRPPFQAGSAASLIAEILKAQPPPLATAKSRITPELDRIIATSLEKDPDDRWQSVRELKHALTWFQVGATCRGARAAGRVRPLRWPAFAASLAAALLTGAAVLPRLVPEDLALEHELRFKPIAADSGAERLPKLSPDGRSIAYSRELRGVLQVFVRSLNTAATAQLTDSDQATVAFWSGDSRLIYFRRRGALWSVSASGGTPQQVLDIANTPMAITPDGNSIAFLDWHDEPHSFDLAVSSPPGAKSKKLTEGRIAPDSILSEMAFSPDGHKLLVPNSGGEAWYFAYPSGKIVRIPWLKKISEVQWLPDSRHVVAETSGNAFVIVDTETPASRPVLSGPNRLINPSISSDGLRLVYSTGVEDSELEEFSITGQRLRTLLQTPLAESSPDWSPAGDEFAYDQAGSGIWIRDDKGTQSRLLVNNPDAYGPVFSPDGRRIAFRVGAAIQIVPAAGGEPVRAAEAGSQALDQRLGGVCWSPDSEWLAYTTGNFGGYLRKLRTSGGGQEEPIAYNVLNGRGSGCSWSRDARWIAYYGKGGIRLVSPDGKENHVLIPGSSMIGRFNRRGEFLAVVRGTQAATWNLETYDALSGQRLSSVPLELLPGLTVTGLSLHPDGRRLAVSVREDKYDIWMVEGFPQPATGMTSLFRHWTF